MTCETLLQYQRKNTQNSSGSQELPCLNCFWSKDNGFSHMLEPGS